MDNGKHTITVENCARCGKNHEVNYKELERPFVESSGDIWTHWGACPVNGDPILISAALLCLSRNYSNFTGSVKQTLPVLR